MRADAGSSNFQGFIEAFDGGRVSGWAMDRGKPAISIEVDLYIEGVKVSSKLANIHRPGFEVVCRESQAKGFVIEVPGDHAGASVVELCFGGTLFPIPPLKGVNLTNRKAFINLESLLTIKPSPFVPAPPVNIVSHITGLPAGTPEAEMHYAYRLSGVILASDIYNVVGVELGLDVTRDGFQIVDIGCGCGRVPSFLVQILPNCRYLGADVWNDAITWAQDTLTPRMPNLQFEHIGGTSTGYKGFSHYPVPTPDESTDLVVGTSIFTHLDETSTLGYFREIARMLTQDGVAFLTFNYLDDLSAPNIERIVANAGGKLIKRPDCWQWGSDGFLDTYHTDKGWRGLAALAGLEMVGLRRGHYLGASAGSNLAALQDLALLKRR